MAYEKTEWSAGDEITSAKLNKIEAGIAEATEAGDEEVVITWDMIDDKPETFAPSEHTHAWGDITGKPSTFAPASHTHQIADVEDLETQLAAIVDRLEALESPAEG